jgi:DNA-binding response OmpR family regulator
MSDLTPRKILFVDDERGLVETCTRHLRKLGHLCLPAYRIDEAIALARAEAPDIVITDLNFPERDGFDLATYVRAEFPHTLVILITAHYSSVSEAAAVQAGFSGYLRKPFSLAELSQIIEKVITT